MIKNKYFFVCRINMGGAWSNPRKNRYVTYLKSACVEKKSWYFGGVFYTKILPVKITVAICHPVGMYICINPWDSPLAKYTPCGCVFGLGTDPLGLIHIVFCICLCADLFVSRVVQKIHTQTLFL